MQIRTEPLSIKPNLREEGNCLLGIIPGKGFSQCLSVTQRAQMEPNHHHILG